MKSSSPQVNYTLVNESGVPDGEILAAIAEQAPDLIAQQDLATLSQWQRRTGGIGDRDRYVTPDKLFDQFKVAADAVAQDDVVAGVAETSEALAFDKMTIFCENEDEQDIWAQISDDLDLETKMRELWREMFAYSQAYVAKFPGRKTYKVSGKSNGGTKRKKAYNLVVPAALTIIDPLKVIPVGNFMFNKEILTYVANLSEIVNINNFLAGFNSTDQDPIVEALFVDKYVLQGNELRLVKQETGVRSLDLQNLYVFNPDNVFRITATRPEYQRFADCRLTSVFELLDLKYQLRQMDRVHLMGAINFIVLVKRGEPDRPVPLAEMQRTAAQVRTNARVPIILGDSSLTVEIVTPKLDKTLTPERYNTLDSRITSRLYNIFNSGGYTSGTANDDSVKLVRLVAKSLETRRSLITKAILKNVIMPIYEENDSLTSVPKIMFEPAQIEMGFDPGVATFYEDLRATGDISRSTILAQLGLIEGDEAIKREREKKYENIFTPTNVPFSGTQDPNNPGTPVSKTLQKTAGRTGGGNSNGGGANKNSATPGKPRGAAKTA